MAILYLMVGLPGAGKTTKAKEIEKKEFAVRFTPDDWIIEKYGNNLSPNEHKKVRDEIENHTWNKAQEELKAGRNAILDFGFWGKSERDKKCSDAKKIGAETKIVFLDASIEELWKRSKDRPETQPGQALHFTREDLEKWNKTFQRPTLDDLKQ